MSTESVNELQDFQEIVEVMPGHYKEVYVRYGVRHLGINAKTAKKRLNDAIAITGSKLFEIQDPKDGRRLRVFYRKPAQPKTAISIGSIVALNVVAAETLKNSMKWSNWEDRLRGFKRSLDIVQSASLQLEQCVAASNGRIKYTRERSQLQRTLININTSMSADRDHDKMAVLLARGVIPPHPYEKAEIVLATKHFKMLRLPKTRAKKG